MASSDEYHVHSAISKMKKKKKLVKQSSVTDEIISNEPKKISTKTMVHQALKDLVTNRKGTSFYAIKKYIETNFNINTESAMKSRLIKKCIKSGVEDGSILQTTGVGATGSFRLPAKKNVTKKKTKEAEAGSKSKEEVKKSKSNTKKDGQKTKKEIEIVIKKSKKGESKAKIAVDAVIKTSKKGAINVKSVEIEEKKLKKLKKMQNSEKVKGEKKKEKIGKKLDTKREKEKMAGGMFTPAKKRAIMKKRKSIGSIIKPPKMRPQ